MATSIRVLKQTFSQFQADKGSTLAASLAYYTIFALPPLLFLLLTLLSHSLTFTGGEENMQGRAKEIIRTNAAQLLGNEAAADVISSILEHNRDSGGAWWKSLLGLLGVLLGAAGVVTAVQTALNQIWHVQPDPERGGIGTFLKKRLWSLAMVMGLGFLLVVSMILATILESAGARIGAWLGIHDSVVRWSNHAVIFAITTIVFAAMFRFMPDARIAWRDVWLGAVCTTVLFVVGRIAMGYYFSYAAPGAELGNAAAALAALLVWVYYSATIFLLGAEFTQAWAGLRGRNIRPEKGAVLVETTIVR